MPTVTLEIVNKLGLHARAAAKFMQTAAAYTCEVAVEKQGKKVNGKSIMGLMMLAASRGNEIRITTEGEGADDALQALVALVNDRFGEPE
ncbi:MAG: HPr family phosphocarrier protein [Gammaproteobacteria bacterium]